MSEWETFCDEWYYHLWRVRRKTERGFNDGFHLQHGEEARNLVELLNRLESERDEARDVVKILCDEKPERPIYFQPDIDEWMERHALAVQECENLQRGLDAAIRERDELRVYLDSAHYATCNKELRKERNELKEQIAAMNRRLREP